MGRTDSHNESPSRIERWVEEFLVRIISGIGMGVLFLAMTPLLLGALNAWWFVATSALGFVVGFVGADAIGSQSRRTRERPRRPLR